MGLGTYDLIFVLVGVVVVEISKEFVELQGDFGLELSGLGGFSFGRRWFFGTSFLLFRVHGL